MPRDAHIPLFLWVATALLIHLLGGNGARRAADWMEERIELKRFVEGVRSYVRSSHDSLEVSIVEDAQPPTETEREEPKPPDAEAEPKDDDEPPEEQAKAAQKPLDPKKPEPEKENRKQPAPEERKVAPEPKPVLVEKKPPAEVEPLVQKKQVAVRQHVEDKEQAENADAEFISEHNNRVKEQTQARLTSNDENDPKPTPGSNASGVGPEPGDSRENRVAHSEDRAGEEARAPADEPASQKPQPSQEAPNAGAAAPVAETHAAPSRTGQQAGENKPEQRAVAPNIAPGSKGQAEQREQAASPDLVASERGAWGVPTARPELQEQEARKSQRKRELPRRKARGFGDLLGLGAAGTTQNGINLNLTPGLAVNAIGVDQLSRERRADGARRRSQHLGSWKSTGIERWRSAIENYVASVKPGNQTALNTARSPFAAYLANIHNRLHPIFADWFLPSLDSLPRSHPMNNPTISTNLEIILDQDEGRVLNMGVTKTSGITAFDIAALDSVQRASPFGAPPREILSPDGRVYLHWEFHRNPVIACTTGNAHPFILKTKPKAAPLPTPTPTPPPPADDERHGSRQTEQPSDAGETASHHHHHETPRQGLARNQ